MTHVWIVSGRRTLQWLAALLVVAACASAPPPAPRLDAERDFDSAVIAATDALVVQMQRPPGLLQQIGVKAADHSIVVIDPMLEGATGQQMAATRRVERDVAERLRTTYPQLELLPFQAVNLARAQYVLTGTITRAAASDPNTRTGYKVNLALTDLKKGVVVAQATSRARDEGVDTNPTPYYRDSPILLVKDKVVEGYIRTCETRPGEPADPVYFQRIAAATLVSEATDAYDSERYQESLDMYRNALADPAGEQLRVFNGIYLASWRLGRSDDAEHAFGQVVALGLANDRLGVKLLFRPGTTDFWPDPRISGPYAFWLRQIARQVAASKVCMEIVGHTSHTGPEQYNDRLSQQRATYIKQRLESEAPELRVRIRATGMGFRENIVGSGTDDGRDVLDRRVEFKVTAC